uniref:CASP-like protein n=1 Tax=Fagus sylvatica TaxID=28930 RepID=A0A2N9F2Q2_FAGSY
MAKKWTQKKKNIIKKKKKKKKRKNKEKETISDQSPPTIHASPPQSHIDKEQEEEQGKHTISDPSPQSSSPQSHINNKSTSPPPKEYSSSLSSLSSSTSPPHYSHSHELNLSSAPNKNPPPKPLAPVANRSFQAEPLVLTKVDPETQYGYTSFREVSQEGADNIRVVVVDGGGSNRRVRSDLHNLRKTRRDKMVKKALLGLRICGIVFCLISFSVMAADKHKGWALDSFYWYKEFRYCMAVNVIGFAYSALQAYDIVKYLSTGRHIIRHHLRHYLDFSMDQATSSSAATRVYDWQSNWGEDEFPEMASASVGLSFVAFLAFALSSLISGYTLCMT